jgi:hypothetical protein
MKTKLALLAALLILVLPVSAQTNPMLKGNTGGFFVRMAQTSTGPTATVSWTQPTGVPTGTTVTLFRCAGTPCTAPTSFTQLVTGVTASGPYVDSTVTAGTYSYYAVNVNGTQTSPSSNIASGTLPLPAPTGLTVTVN